VSAAPAYAPRVILLGGGHAHALVLRYWHAHAPGLRVPGPRVRLTVINPKSTAPYSGMLPGYVAGHYQKPDLDIDLPALAHFAGAEFIMGTATGIDTAAKTVAIAGHPDPLPYDLLSINIGVTSILADLPGFIAHAIPARPLDRFAARWAAFCAAPPAAPAITVLGGGVAGVELAMATRYRLIRQGAKPIVTILERGAALTTAPGATRRRLCHALDAAGVKLAEHTMPKRISADAVHLASGKNLASDLTIGAAGARPHPWLSETGLETKTGFLSVTETLQTTRDPAIYAVGDCACLSHAPRPKAGVFAVRAAPILMANLKAAVTGDPQRPFHPQRDYLKLISLGSKSALGEKRGIAVCGRWVWYWKDRIDRRFMNQFHNLPGARL